MKSTPITKRAYASPLKSIGDDKTSGSKSSSSSQSYEADASGNLFKVDRTQSAGDFVSNASAAQKPNVKKAVGGGTAGSGYDNAMKKHLNDGASYEDLASLGHGTVSGLNKRFPGYEPKASSNSSSTESSNSETKAPVMRAAEPGNKGMETDTRWAWQQRNINRTQNSQERQNRGEARKDMKYLESEGLVQSTGKTGRGKGWELTESGAASADAGAMFKANKRDIFGADRNRFTRDQEGNVQRNEAYDVQDSRKNRAQTGSYDPHDTYIEARPEEQWNVNKHGAYGSTTSAASTSSSDDRSSSSSMFNNGSDAPPRGQAYKGSDGIPTVELDGIEVASSNKSQLSPKPIKPILGSERSSTSMDAQDQRALPVSKASVPAKGMSDLPGEPLPRNGASANVKKQSGILSEGSRTMPSDYEPDFSEKPILGSESSYQMTRAIQGGLSEGIKESGPTPSYRSRGNMEAVKEESPVKMKLKHNPRMMYGDSPAKMWGPEKVQAQSKLIGDFRSSTAGKPITNVAAGLFNTKGRKK
jgi:hypothetical protein